MSRKRKEQNSKKANGQKALILGTVELSKNIIICGSYMLLQTTFLKVFKLESVKKRQCRVIVFSMQALAYLGGGE